MPRETAIADTTAPEARAPTKAKNHPVQKAKKAIDTRELPIGHTVRKTTAQSNVGIPELVAVDERVFVDEEHAAMMAFMEEPITIRPLPTRDPKELVYEVIVNNESQLFIVNQDKTVKRKFADRLALTKITTYTQKETFNEEGIKQILNVPQTIQKYPFQVVRDDNPMGDTWLRATLAMAG